jgi:hypothetical protein
VLVGVVDGVDVIVVEGVLVGLFGATRRKRQGEKARRKREGESVSFVSYRKGWVMRA